MHFRNAGEEKVVWERCFLKNKLFIVMIDVIILLPAGSEGYRYVSNGEVFRQLLEIASMTSLPSLVLF